MLVWSLRDAEPLLHRQNNKQGNYTGLYLHDLYIHIMKSITFKSLVAAFSKYGVQIRHTTFEIGRFHQ